MSIDRWVDLALGTLRPEVAKRLAQDPVAALRQDLGLKVQSVAHLDENRADGGACDGVSFLRDGVILYRATPGNRRENFTLAHELGHWLVDQAQGVYDWLLEQSDPPKVLETVCDRIAQRLLIPEAIVRAVLADDPVRARHVQELVVATQASRPACAIALANHLSTLGAVVIISRADGVVEYASVNPDPDEGWPTVFPWPGQAVPTAHPLARLATGARLTRKAYWRAPWGAEEEYYVDAVAEERRVIAVLSDIDVWGAERLHLDAPREYDQRPVTEINCCGGQRAVRGYPCPTCREPFCPVCSRCRCDRRAQTEESCRSCFLVFQSRLLVDGRCEECRS